MTRKKAAKTYGKRRLKIQVDVDRLAPEGKGHIQPSAGAWPYVQFGGGETRPERKERCLSLSWTNAPERLLSPSKTWCLRQLSSLGVKVQAIIAGAPLTLFGMYCCRLTEEAVALTRKTVLRK